MPDDPKHISDAIERFIANPPKLLTEAEARAAQRALHVESRRDRLMSSPIVESLGESDGVTDVQRILRETYSPTLAMRAVQRWVGMWTDPVTRAVARPVLILAGPTGVGKTVAAAWCVAEVGARYVRFPELVHDYRAFSRKNGIDELERTRNEFRRKYGGQVFVILDELGIEKEADRGDACEALHMFVEIRQTWSQRTLILTNKNNAELRDRFASGQYDPRTLDRLRRLLVTATDNPELLALDLGGKSMRVVR